MLRSLKIKEKNTCKNVIRHDLLVKQILRYLNVSWSIPNDKSMIHVTPPVRVENYFDNKFCL